MKSPKNVTTPQPKDEPYNGWANYDTYWTVHVILNDENLYNLVKELWTDGFKSWGSLSNKMREYGPKWQSNYTGLNYVCWKNPKVRGGQVTETLNKFFSPSQTTK
jgi:hypothetical protein